MEKKRREPGKEVCPFEKSSRQASGEIVIKPVQGRPKKLGVRENKNGESKVGDVMSEGQKMRSFLEKPMNSRKR